MLFTFPSRYWYTIGLTGVFSLAGWARQIRAGLLVSRVTQDTTRPHLDSHTGLSPSMIELSRTFCSQFEYHGVVLQPLVCIATNQVWALPRSLATTGGIISYFLFLEVLRCFSSLRSPPDLVRIIVLQTIGLSHSEISGSKVICTYPELIAAYHVLHRLREPRHPPCALNYFRQMNCYSKKNSKSLILSAVDSYNLIYSLACVNMSKISSPKGLVENNGFEPLTPCLQSRCSSQLS